MINVSEFSFPIYGSHYDPFISAIIFTVVAGIVVVLWGSKDFDTISVCLPRFMNEGPDMEASIYMQSW